MRIILLPLVYGLVWWVHEGYYKFRGFLISHYPKNKVLIRVVDEFLYWLGDANKAIHNKLIYWLRGQKIFPRQHYVTEYTAGYEFEITAGKSIIDHILI